MSRAMDPFANMLALLTLGPPVRLPKTPTGRLVLAGKVVRRKSQIDEVALDDAERAELHKKLQQLRDSQRYQNDRLDPQAMAKRQEREDAAREKRLEYQREWRAKNKDVVREGQRDWYRRKYLANPEAMAAKRRASYHANIEREHELAAARRERKRAAKAALIAQSTTTTTTPTTPTEKG